MPRDQFGRRIRPGAAERQRAVVSRRRRLYARIGAGGLVVLAVVLAAVAAQSK